MPQNVLITGGSGYLGGTLLARWKEAKLDGYDNLFALVRTEVQADAVKQYGATPLNFSPYDEDSVAKAVTQHRINVVFFLIDVSSPKAQVCFIKALSTLKEETGQEVHFLHTTGAKVFSSHAGAPTDRPIQDNDPELYAMQKNQKAPHAFMQGAVDTNCTVIEQGEAYDVRTYIFIPCIVYGKGEGFGNRISIQTVAIVRAAKAAGQVYKVTDGRPTWPVCHILDNTALYLDLLRTILKNQDLGHGRTGYYLASSGSVVWDDLYAAMAAALAKRSVIKDDKVILADDFTLEKMAVALHDTKAGVEVHLAGRCTLTAKHAKEIGWVPQYPSEHALEAAEVEVDYILQNLR